jgi:hypothetical protein
MSISSSEPRAHLALKLIENNIISLEEANIFTEQSLKLYNTLFEEAGDRIKELFNIARENQSLKLLAEIELNKIPYLLNSNMLEALKKHKISFAEVKDLPTDNLAEIAEVAGILVSDSFIKNNALKEAARTDNKSLVELLLEKADQEIHADYRGWALEQAASKGHVAIVQLLLEKSRQNINPVYMNWAIKKANSKGHHQVVELIQQNNLKKD